MRANERKERIGLLLLISAMAFFVQLVAILVAVGLIHIFMQTGVISELSKDSITPGRTLLLMSIISVVVGILISALSGKFFLQPVNRYIDQMNRLAAGDFKARIHFKGPIGSHPTFQEVEKSFNTAAAELEQTEMLRSDFINNFSHEFKTPIVSIAGFAKLLRRGNLTPEQQEEYLAVIEEESLRLAYMATSVLDLTKIENQTILTDVTRFNVSEQVRSAILLLEEKWTKKNLDFNLRIGEVNISANEELLKHVWINLLDNAIKFSDDYGCIDILVEEKNENIFVAISNTGKPIPAEGRDRIFNKFYQADESHSTQGNGIGLAIVKKVVELHQGTISVQSNQNLTAFTVELPKA